MWTEYEIEWKFMTKLCGSVPADPDIQRKWLESRMPKVRPPEGRSLEEIQAELAESMPDIEEQEEERLAVFQRFEGGLVMRMSTVRAHFKDCGRMLSTLYYGKPQKTKGVDTDRSFNVRVLNGVYYPPENYWVPVLSQMDGSQVKEPSGLQQKTIHVQTRQGPRSAFKTFEYVENAMMRFQVRVLTTPTGKPVVGENELYALMDYGGTHGYGGERGDGEGRYAASFKRLK